MWMLMLLLLLMQLPSVTNTLTTTTTPATQSVKQHETYKYSASTIIISARADSAKVQTHSQSWYQLHGQLHAHIDKASMLRSNCWPCNQLAQSLVTIPSPCLFPSAEEPRWKLVTPRGACACAPPPVATWLCSPNAAAACCT